MHRSLVIAFWGGVLVALGAFAFTGFSGWLPGIALGLLSAWAALGFMALMCWRDRGTRSSLWDTLTGRQAEARPGDPDLQADVSGIQVAAALVLGKELLACLRGGRGTYRAPGAEEASDWPEGAELCLSWRGSRRGVAATASQLNLWQELRTPLRLLSRSACYTVLMSDERHRVLLPPLTPPTGNQRALPGPK